MGALVVDCGCSGGRCGVVMIPEGGDAISLKHNQHIQIMLTHKKIELPGSAS